MTIPKQTQAEIDKFVEAIRKTAKEINPNIKVGDYKITGLLIIQFPEDHAETTKIDYTAIGKICFNHTIELLAELKALQVLGENKHAE